MNTISQNHGLIQIDHYTDFLNITRSEREKFLQDDAVWIITSSFIIFTMHSGFGLLESGSVSAKDEVNIMVKNVVDVVFGGISYWAVGYGLSYGDAKGFENPFIGWGKFFYDPTRSDTKAYREGWAYSSFLFQLSFATTAATIVSGAVAERAKLKSYILLGCFVVLIQALPAHWIWDRNGFFFAIGVVDFAGCSAVHMVGGVIGLMATIYLKPRRNRFSKDSLHQMSSPTNALLGTFMLWWGWFGINCGSVWGITGGRWRLGARSAVATIMSSIGGGATAIVVSFIKTRKLQVNHLIYGLLSSIVSITAICAVARPWQAMVIGSISSAVSISILPLLEKLQIDDPVGVIPVHLTSSIWGMFAVGIFAEDDRALPVTFGQYGLIYSGSFKLLGIQMLCSLTIIVYSAVLGLAVLMGLGKSPLGLRVTDYEEQIGADVVEHGLAGTNIARYHIERPISTKTFATVTKALTKWKLQTRNHSRAQRQQKILERMNQRKEFIENINNNFRLRSPKTHHQQNGSAIHIKDNESTMKDNASPEKRISPTAISHTAEENYMPNLFPVPSTSDEDIYVSHPQFIEGIEKATNVLSKSANQISNGEEKLCNTPSAAIRPHSSIAATDFILDEIKDPHRLSSGPHLSTITANPSSDSNLDETKIANSKNTFQSIALSHLKSLGNCSTSRPDTDKFSTITLDNPKDPIVQEIVPANEQLASSFVTESQAHTDTSWNISLKGNKNKIAPAKLGKSRD